MSWMPQKSASIGGGGLDARFDITPIGFALNGLPPGLPALGPGFQKTLGPEFHAHHGSFLLTALRSPSKTTVFRSTPTSKTRGDLPALRMTYKDHPDDMKLQNWLNARALELLDAAGATKKWSYPITEQEFAVHLLGTCRMGNDSKTSVINADHRTHDVKNLFLCDGSSFVTSGRGQPTMTIEALAFRAADRITDLAKRGELNA